ncbi:MAG TPA: 4-hydroxy-tetrahydrodipicolinate synthase [Bacillota bacterium]|nr:4-hydroxy-tetrahydrodipicolinate synthase [Bacillota bacterium]
MKFGDIMTAMVTPFNENDEIDFGATEKLVEHLIATGTEGLIIAGTTGESPTLTMEEQIELFKFVVKQVDGRIPVIAGAGSNNTKEAIHLTKNAEAAGVDGIMTVVPYYNKPSQAGLYEHFKTIAASTKLPIMLYNIPGRSSVNMSVDTIVELSKIENIVSVKEASADLDAMADIIQRTDEDFTLYSGDDGLTLPVLSIGGQGVVSVSAHVIGTEMKEMVHAFKEGNVKKAADLHRQLLPTMNAMFSAPSPTPVKAALEMIGIPVGDVRLPLVSLTEEELEFVRKHVK